jgi:hypothetical protein
MQTMERIAKIFIAVIVTAASVTSFAESYRALFIWATRHDVPFGWAVAWPLQVDVFIATGELCLFIALARRWSVRSRAAAWAVTLTGLAVSVAGNVGHVQGSLATDRLTAAVPPVAAACSLAVGLGILKRIVSEVPASVPEIEVTSAYTPRHSDRLADMGSDARRIKYAAEVIPSRDPREITAWLAGLGFEVSPENARTALRRAPALVPAT